MKKGKVHLVGAGPGDPELISLKGLRCIQMADVLLYDDLVNEALVDEAGPTCEKIYVGKRAGFRAKQQEEINALLIEKSLAGSRVVRLKGGDPFLLGRGGEEAETLKKAKVEWEVVPGVTSATAAAAHAGIPLTYRGVSGSVTVVTGHEDPKKPGTDVRWEALARVKGTLVILMGVGRRARIARRLIAGGLSPKTPIAVVRWASLPDQETVRATLGDLGGLEIRPPAVMIVGDVARFDLSWFESRPLFGRYILVTRTRSQGSDLVRRLRTLGAKVAEVPTIRISDPDDWVPVDRAISQIQRFDWLIFASPNAVERLFGRIFSVGQDLRILKGCRVAAVGPATRKKVESYYVRVKLTPDTPVAEGLLKALDDRVEISGQRFLVPRSGIGRKVLVEGLRDRGGEVTEIVAYRTERPEGLPHRVGEGLAAGEINLVTFTSSSTVSNFARLVGPEMLSHVTRNLPAACIGQVTAETAREAGFKVVAEPPADQVSIPGMVEGILTYFVGHSDALRGVDGPGRASWRSSRKNH